jgi:hypothetical protein
MRGEVVMKRILGCLLVIVIFFCSGYAFADKGKLMLNAHYNIPLNSTEMEESLDFGVGFRFWGIFVVGGSVYTQIIYGADNFINIQDIVPIGLASFGFGMQIPLGGFDLVMDWQKFFTRVGTQEGVYSYSGSFKFGGIINIGEVWGIELYNRKLNNFSGNSGVTVDQVNMFGAGVVFYFL